MPISQVRGGRPNSAANSAANPLPRRVNSAAGRLEEFVRRLLIFLYLRVTKVRFLGRITRLSPAGRGKPSGLSWPAIDHEPGAGHEASVFGGEKDDLKARRAARDCDGAGARYFGEPQRLHQRDEGVELFARSRHLEDKAFGRRIDDAG